MLAVSLSLSYTHTSPHRYRHIYSCLTSHARCLSLSLSDVARAIELLEKLQESGDVPGHKLQSLKKVLQSEFCTAIREVSPWHTDPSHTPPAKGQWSSSLAAT